MQAGESAQRLFFALWPDPAVRAALAGVTARLPLPRGRLTPPQNLHVTLVFLGAAAAVRSQMHIRIDVMAPVFRKPMFAWLNTVTVLCGIVILGVAVWACYEQFMLELVVDSPMMGVSKAWFFAGMPIGLALMLVHVLRVWMDSGAAPVFRGETEALVIKEGGVQ